MAIAVANAYTSPQTLDSIYKRNNVGHGDENVKLQENQPSEKAAAKAGSDKGDGLEQEFFWAYTEEPHRTRRQAIIKAHPEVCVKL